VYGLGLIGQESNGEYLSYHFDFRGSTVALTDETAQIVERFQYSPYGLLLSGDSSITPFLFNGMYGVMSDGNGLYYMRARFYSSEIRRFVNQDILIGDIFDGQTLNRFAFVIGNPITKVDIFGTDTLDVMFVFEFLKQHMKFDSYPSVVMFKPLGPNAAGSVAPWSCEYTINNLLYGGILNEEQAFELLNTVIHELIHYNKNIFSRYWDAYIDPLHPDVVKEAKSLAEPLKEEFIEAWKVDMKEWPRSEDFCEYECEIKFTK